MKTVYFSLLVASLPILVASQASAPSGAPSAPLPSAPGAPSGAPSAPSAPAAPGAPVASVVSYSLKSQNPTAVPLASINSAEPTTVTIPLAATPAAGSQPTFLPGAPGLPNVSPFNPAPYPPLDKVPPTDSPEVQQWIKDVQATGIQIPNIAPTVAGGCPANAQAAADKSRCWWTCDGCTRDTDVTTCPDKLTWGSSFDDGPAFYTPNLLQYLDQVKLKTTFFVVGSRVISSPVTLQAQYMGQHQIAVHTWSHPQLTMLTNEQIIAELGWSKKAIKDVLGVTPNMFRPPYGDIDDRVRAILSAMDLTPVMWTRISPTQTFDTQDFDVKGGSVSSSQVLANWNTVVANATSRNDGFITLQHDLWEQAVELATGYILPDALAHNPPFKIEPVIQCLNKPITMAYIETNDNKTNPPPSSGKSVTTLQPGGAQTTGTGNGSEGNAGIANWAGLSYTMISLAFGAVIAGTVLA